MSDDLLRRLSHFLREVLGEPGHVHFRVRWEDEHESVFYPSSDTIVHPATHPNGGHR